MHRSVALILLNKEGKILFQHRTKDAPTYPDQWGFFGGSIEEGEAPEAAVVRETKEELGLVLKNPIFLGTVVDLGDPTERYFFKEELDVDEIILKAGQKEGDDLKFFSLEEAKQFPVMTEARWNFLLSGLE
jgi:8-oxo-dGTP diphosphatase